MIRSNFHRFFNFLKSSVRLSTCSYSSSAEGNCLSKYVYISESNDIFVNLAFEDWLYQNNDFSKRQILLLWRNKPTVVIGRHQNPWLEVNVKLAKNANIMIARRNSGGGAVYHDLNNLNLSFFTSKGSYNREHNLKIITSSLRNEWGINCEINDREDIMFDEKKISGTASKLGKQNAYHHCTLLIDCNKKIMSEMLSTNDTNIVTSASRSVKSSVINLRESNSFINVDRLIAVVGLKYLSAYPFLKSSAEGLIVVPKGFQFISPDEKYFPGLNKKIEQFNSWDWIYGRTPKFRIEFTFAVAPICSSDSIKLCLEIENAIVRNVDVLVPTSFLVFVTSESMRLVTTPFLGHKFTPDLISRIEEILVNYFQTKLQDERLNCVLY